MMTFGMKDRTMKTTLSTQEIAQMLREDENGGWTYNGSVALALFLEELDNDCGMESEFDRVVIRCDFSEYESLKEFADGYTFEPDGLTNDEQDDSIREFIQENGMLIEFDGGIIVNSF